MRMHYGRIGGDGAAEDIIGISKVDDHDLVLLIDLFPNANKSVGFERQSLDTKTTSPLSLEYHTHELTRPRTWNEMEAGWTPTLESCKCSQKLIGFCASILATRNE